MLRHQRTLLQQLRKSDNFVILKADKNLGPCILEKHIYIQRALQDHLLDQSTYQQLTRDAAVNQMRIVKTNCLKLLVSKHRKDMT